MQVIEIIEDVKISEKSENHKENHDCIIRLAKRTQEGLQMGAGWNILGEQINTGRRDFEHHWRPCQIPRVCRRCHLANLFDEVVNHVAEFQ